jgi:hypothetical protein
MYTNQAAEPGQFRPPDLSCNHAPGEGHSETCTYLRALDRVRAWADRAEQAHREGKNNRMLLSELWMIYAETSTAHDLCPDHAALVPAN